MGKSGLALAMAGALGILAYVGMKQVIRNRDEEVKKRTDPIWIVVADKPLKAGTKLRGSDVSLAEFPGRLVLPGTLTRDDDRLFLGRMLAKDMSRGQPLLLSDLKEEGAEAEALSIERGKRLATVAVDEVAGVAGLLQEGDRVDVVVTVSLPPKDGSGQERTVTRMLLTNVEVERVGAGEAGVRRHVPEGRGRDYTAVTLVVTPREAQLLSFAQAKGRIALLLRDRKDAEGNEVPPETDLDSLFPQSSEAVKVRRESPLKSD